MTIQPSTDSFGLCLLGLRCSWWHSRQANDALASEQSLFSENQDYKSCFPVRTYGLDARGGRKQRTDTHARTHARTHAPTHAHSHGTTTVTLAAHARRGLMMNAPKLLAAGSRPVSDTINADL